MENIKILELDIKKVTPNPEQPRKNFDKEELNELSESIKVHGQVTPIVVFKKDDKWIIVCGERRYRAIKKMGGKTILAIEKKYAQPIDYMTEAIIENIQRKDLSEEERYNYFKKIMEEENITSINGLARKLGVPSRAIHYLFNVKEAREELGEEGKIVKPTVIQELLPLSKPERKRYLSYSQKNDMSGHALRGFIKDLKKMTPDIKEEVLEGTITLNQAKGISLLKDKKQRENSIKEFKALKFIEKNIVNNIERRNTEKQKREFKKKLAEAGVWLKGLRRENVATLRQLEKFIKVLLISTNFVNVMDEKQIETLNLELESFIQKCEGAEQLAKKIQEDYEKC
jgi:ParB family chromosome partitioning protein